MNKQTTPTKYGKSNPSGPDKQSEPTTILRPERTLDVVVNPLDTKDVPKVGETKVEQTKSSSGEVTRYTDYGIGIEKAP